MEAGRLESSTIRGEELKDFVPYRGRLPRVQSSVFIAEGARIVGDVEIGEESSVWFNAVVRGDVNTISIGSRTNVQDNSVLHVTERSPLLVGSEVTVGHSVILHGCSVEDCCLIGMGSIILDDARIRRHSMVAAGLLVLQGFEVPEGTLVAGVPAKVKRALTQEEIQQLARSAEQYVAYGKTYLGNTSRWS